jgi:hypothetical protein
MRHKLLLLLLIACTGACAPRLGDGCERSADCSVQGDRICDLAQPGGYCTIADCEPGGCGDEGVCVRWQPDEPRVSRTWCMANCDNCDRDRYACRSAAQLNEGREAALVEVVDSKKSQRFCVLRED